MTQVDVALTDYALAVECAVLTLLVARMRTGASAFRWSFVLFFFSIALASATGGTVHGFFSDGTFARLPHPLAGHFSSDWSGGSERHPHRNTAGTHA